MHEYARVSPGPGFRPVRAGLYYSQRLITNVMLRKAVSRSISAGINLRHRGALADDRDDVRDAAATLRAHAALERDGLVLLPELLPPAAIAAIADWLRDKPVVAGGCERPLAQLPPGTRLAAYPLVTVLDCPHVLALANHPMVLGVARRYLGCVPTISSIGIRWSFPDGGQCADVQMFHRDTTGYRFCNLFLHLTDVDPDSGPHIYVAGSHRTSGRFLIRPYDSDDIERRYGRQNVRTIVGVRGSAFMADTYGIHKGAPPRRKPRLMLQVAYSLLPNWLFVYRPLAIAPRPPVDPYVNRLLVH